MANKIIHKRSIKPGSMPTGSTLDFGEIAVNYNSSEPFLSIRTTVSGQTDMTYAKFIDENGINDKLSKKSDSTHTHSQYENQKAFSNVAVSENETVVSADSATDTLTLAAGDNITITPDKDDNKITIGVTGLSKSGHNHDDSYYLKSETYTKTETDAQIDAQIDAKLAANDAMLYKGTISAESNFPQTFEAGWTYKVATAGTYFGQKLEIGDMVIAVKDATTSTTTTSSNFATYWTAIQTNSDGLVSGPTSSVDNRVAVFDGTTGKLIKDSGFTIAKSVPSEAVFTDESTTKDGHYPPLASDDDVLIGGIDINEETGVTEVSIPVIKHDVKGHIVEVSSESLVMPQQHTATTGQTGVVKLVTGDMKDKSHADGQAPSLNHTHSQYQPAGSYALKDDLSGYLTTSGTAADSNKLGGVAASQYVKYISPDSDIFTNFTAYPYFAAKWLSEQGDFGTIVIPTYANNNTDYFFQTELRFDNRQGLKYRNVNYESVGEWYTIATTNDLSGYLTTGGTAADSSKLGGTEASSYALKSDLSGVFTGATSSANGAAGLVPAPTKGYQTSFLRADGMWAVPVKNTAGSSNSSAKLYLVGAEGQSLLGVQTYSNSAVYMQAGKLYANGSEVGTMETINSTVSALTASNVNLDSRISALENNGGGISIAVGTDKTYLMGASSTTATTVNIQTGSTSSENGVWMSNGTITATKGFYQVSDEREKNFTNELDIDFNKLKTIPKSYFTWKGDEDKKLEIGTSAQKLKEVYPELVSYDSVDDRYTVSYDKLSIIALKAVDKLHEENKMLRAELDMIKKHIGL